MNSNTLTGINLGNRVPLMGQFGVWNRNADGPGPTKLTSESCVTALGYAFKEGRNTLPSPQSQRIATLIEQDGYAERGVSTPLTVAGLKERSTRIPAGHQGESAAHADRQPGHGTGCRAQGEPLCGSRSGITDLGKLQQ